MKLGAQHLTKPLGTPARIKDNKNPRIKAKKKPSAGLKGPKVRTVQVILNRKIEPCHLAFEVTPELISSFLFKIHITSKGAQHIIQH